MDYKKNKFESHEEENNESSESAEEENIENKSRESDEEEFTNDESPKSDGMFDIEDESLELDEEEDSEDELPIALVGIAGITELKHQRFVRESISESSESDEDESGDDGTKESVNSADSYEIHMTLTRKMDDFINESKRGRVLYPLQTSYSGQNEPKTFRFFAEFFPNGHGEEHKGYVSLTLDRLPRDNNMHSEGICIVSVIDALAAERFSQSFTIPYPFVSTFYIDKYISRDKLLSEPDELLPNGLMTLKIDARFTLYPVNSIKFNAYGLRILDKRLDIINQDEFLFESPLGKRLAEESDVFRDVSGMPPSKRGRDVMYFDDIHTLSFYYAGSLLMGGNPLTLDSFTDIFDMYVFADKYYIPFVMDTCTCFLKLCLFVHGTDELFKAADEHFEKIYWNELIKNKISSISQTNFAKEIEITDDGVSLIKPVRNCLWVYMQPGKSSQIIFLNKNASKNCNWMNVEYAFYK